MERLAMLAMPWLEGAEFLPVYAAVLAATFGLALALRWRLRAPGPCRDEPALTRYEAVAYLGGGPERAIAAALGSLMESETLALVTAGGLRNARRVGALPADA